MEIQNPEKSQIKQYYNGIYKNYKAIQDFYPGWTMRLYHDLDQNNPQSKEICEFACRNTNIDLCDVTNIPGSDDKI